MVRRANKAGFKLAHIHDSYWCSPVHMGEVRQFYKDILIEIAKSNLLEDICSQIAGEKINLSFTHPDLWKDMEDAEYMLS
jgi:DNA-directed RNA polymerase